LAYPDQPKRVQPICSVLTRETQRLSSGLRGVKPVVEPMSAITILPPEPVPDPSPAVSQTRNS
jgi:hypothetical protein